MAARGRPRRLAAFSHLTNGYPSRATSQPGEALGATRRNPNGQAGAPEPGMWGARPLVELAPVDRPAAEPASQPSLGAPIGSSRSPLPTPRLLPPPASRDGNGVGEGGRPKRGGGGELSSR